MDNKKNNLENSSGSKKSSPREVDMLTQDVRSWWGNTFVFIKKTKVRTWLAVSIVAFVAGATTAVILTVSNNIQTNSKAAGESASLSLSTDSATVAKDDTFDLEVNLDTHLSSVVVVKAIINYNKDDFQLTNVDTITGDFEVDRCSGTPSALCAIVDDNSANGKLALTVSKPSPGINSASATVATLTFLALRTTTPSSPNITLSYTEGSYEDSDVILDDGQGTDILNSVDNISITVVPVICTSWKYSEWGDCQSSGKQNRTILTYSPESCAGGNPEVLEQDCTYVPPVCTDFNYSEWSACQVDSTQSRTATGIPAGCAGGAEPVLAQSCEYIHQDQAPTCESFQYSEWSVCQINNTQSRTANSSPAGCIGGSPILTQDCTYIVDSNTNNNSQNSNDNEHRSKPKEKPAPKRHISNNDSVKRGNIITEKGKNFSKNSRITLYFSKPGGGYYPPRIQKTDSKGNFWITYRIPQYRPVGKYSWYAVDTKTGKKSKVGYYTVK